MFTYEDSSLPRVWSDEIQIETAFLAAKDFALSKLSEFTNFSIDSALFNELYIGEKFSPAMVNFLLLVYLMNLEYWFKRRSVW